MAELDRQILAMRQALPLEDKVELTKCRVREFYTQLYGEVYVSYSGGKDSTVLAHIVKGMYPDVPLVFCDTGIEYPEVRKLATENADVVLRPQKNFKQVVEQYGYPFPSKEQARFVWDVRHSTDNMRDMRLHGTHGKRFTVSDKWMPLVNAPFEVSNRCCDVMKKQPFKRYEKETGRRPIIATMADESDARLRVYLKDGCNTFSERPSSKPISFWTEQDVLKYIADNGLEIPSVYGEIVSRGGKYETTECRRTGCVFCMFGVASEQEPNRFQRLEETHPALHDYCINKLGIGAVLDYCGIPHSSNGQQRMEL